MFIFELYTDQELRTLHRTFGHPSVRALQNLLEWASGSKIEKNIVQTLEKMKEDCMVCMKTSAAPRKLRVTFSTSELRFSHLVQVRTKVILGRPVVLMVKEATRFCAASFLRTKSIK